jgi:fatty-acyl-CoA synthase
VAGQDGRAGMAAITPKTGIDLKLLYAHLAASLPAYARPVFLRFQDDVEITGTLKVRKVDLVKDGFDPMNITDPLFVVDNEARSYKPITPEVFRGIIAGGMRL